MEKFLLFLITPSFAYCNSLGHDIATYLEKAVGRAVGERIGSAIGGVAGGVLGELIGQEGIIPGAMVAGGVAAIGTAHILSKYKKYT